VGESGNDDYPPTELLYNKVKAKLLAWDINMEVIASDLRVTKTARFNPYEQSYKVLRFQSYYYLNYNLITIVFEILIKEHKCLRSSDTVPTVHSQVPRLETPLQIEIYHITKVTLSISSVNMKTFITDIRTILTN